MLQFELTGALGDSLNVNPSDKRQEEVKTAAPCMKRGVAQSNRDIKARRWARRLSQRVKKIVAAHPDADPDNIRHTLK